MSWIILTYGVYVLASLGIILPLGHQLHRHGRPFLVTCVGRSDRVVDAVNDLLLVGFYLVNGAFALFLLSTPSPVTDGMLMMNVLSEKLGLLALILGGMHFFNLLSFISWQRIAVR